MASISRVMLLAAAVLAASCSSAPPPASVTGAWSGSWKSNDPNASPSTGTVVINATQSGSNVTGTGTVSPLASGVLQSSTYVSGRWVGTLAATLGSVQFDANVAGDAASGTYTTSLGDKGSFNLTKSR